MRYTVYIFIEGKLFDPEAFNRNLPPELCGEVKERTHMRVARQAQRFYWQSKLLESDKQPEDGLAELLAQYRAVLTEVAREGTAKISAEIVAHLGRNETRGLYLPADLIKALAELQADIDFDVYSSQ